MSWLICVVWRYLWLLVTPLIPTISNASSITTRWQTWIEVHTHTHTHTHTLAYQLSVTVYLAADSFLSNAIPNSNQLTAPPTQLFTCPCNNTSTWQIRHHDVNKIQEIDVHLTKTNRAVCVCVCVCARVCMCVKCVSLITASRGSWLKCEGAPSHSARHWERTDSGTYLTM